MGKLFSSSIFYLALAFAFAATVECRNGFLSHLKEEILEEMRQGDASQECEAADQFWDGQACLSCSNYNTAERCGWVSTSPLGNGAVTNCILACVNTACPYGDECEYWVDDGCKSRGNGPDDGFYKSQDATAFVRCCYEGKKGTKCDTISDCKDNTTLATYAEATEQCAEKGWRLCTKDELRSDICCKTGGGCHSSEIWTSEWEQKSDDVATDVPDWCPSGFTAISQNLDGEGKMWIPPSRLSEWGETIESACAFACTQFHPKEMEVPCTGFEFGPAQSTWGPYKEIGENACAVFTAGEDNISNNAGRLNRDSPWKSCIIEPY